ncbi:MAG: hypothetical protein R2861_13960 [Desulfobacterales bacterium]
MPFLGEAIRRMRDGNVHILPGFDGEYGRINVFAPEEKDRLTGQKELFQIPKSTVAANKTKKPAPGKTRAATYKKIKQPKPAKKWPWLSRTWASNVTAGLIFWPG